MAHKQKIPASLETEALYVQFSDWTGGRTIPAFGSTAGMEPLPFQTWRPFKEAFAPELVERALFETPGKVEHIADPFGGSGTTALACQFLGIPPTTIEVNPFLADLIESKISLVDFDTAIFEFARVIERVAREDGPVRPVFVGAPVTFVEPGLNGRYIFSSDIARRIIIYRTAIEAIQDIACRRLFRVLLASVVVPVSNVNISGKGRRYKRGWTKRETPPELVDELFRSRVLCALHDLRRFASRQCLEYRVLRGDARLLSYMIGPCDLAVFSPPYPNSFDYTDVYNVELWALGYLSNTEDNAQLRHSTLRSHVQVFRKFATDDLSSRTLSSTIKCLCEVREDLWNRHIPEMIGAYFEDLVAVLSKLAIQLRTRGRIYMIVGDSRYAGIEVPVATILTEICRSIGYDVIVLEPCRSMRSSPQQGGRNDLEETLVVLERR